MWAKGIDRLLWLYYLGGRYLLSNCFIWGTFPRQGLKYKENDIPVFSDLMVQVENSNKPVFLKLGYD